MKTISEVKKQGDSHDSNEGKLHTKTSLYVGLYACQDRIELSVPNSG